MDHLRPLRPTWFARLGSPSPCSPGHGNGRVKPGQEKLMRPAAGVSTGAGEDTATLPRLSAPTRPLSPATTHHHGVATGACPRSRPRPALKPPRCLCALALVSWANSPRRRPPLRPSASTSSTSSPSRTPRPSPSALSVAKLGPCLPPSRSDTQRMDRLARCASPLGEPEPPPPAARHVGEGHEQGIVGGKKRHRPDKRAARTLPP